VYNTAPDDDWGVISWRQSLTATTFDGLPIPEDAAQRMTLRGTVNKSFLLLVVLLLAGAWPWGRFFQAQDERFAMQALLVGTLGGFVVALIITFVKTTAPYLAIPLCSVVGRGAVTPNQALLSWVVIRTS
jgi:uncharacterized YccA/Bax inhibitor family protein